MARKKAPSMRGVKRKQTTDKGMEIPVPKRFDFFENLKRVTESKNARSVRPEKPSEPDHKG